jgi:hypothetical protein
MGVKGSSQKLQFHFPYYIVLRSSYQAPTLNLFSASLGHELYYNLNEVTFSFGCVKTDLDLIFAYIINSFKNHP